MENLPVEMRAKEPQRKKRMPEPERGRKDSPKRHEEAPGRSVPPTRPAREPDPHDEGRDRETERDRDSEIGVDEG